MVKVSRISGTRIGKAWDQESRKKPTTKIISTGELIDIRETNTSINLTKGHIMPMFNEAST